MHQPALPPPSPPPADGVREIMPALGLVERVLLPGSRCCVVLTTVSSYGAVREATRSPAPPVLSAFCATPGGASDPLSSIGVVATVVDLGSRDGRWVAALRGIGRVRKHETLRTQPFRLALVEQLAAGEDRSAPPALVAAVLAAAARFTRARRCIAATVREHLRAAAPWELPGVVMPLLDEVVPWTAWQTLLEADSTEEQLAFVLAHLHAQGAAH
jgi:Lon protease-like protein